MANLMYYYLFSTINPKLLSHSFLFIQYRSANYHPLRDVSNLPSHV